MADITMCSGENCPVKEKCYRYTAIANKFGQSYFSKVPGKIENNQFECIVYWGEDTENIWNQLINIMK